MLLFSSQMDLSAAEQQGGALNNAFKGDHHVGENNIVQELTKAILGEVKRMAGNDVCCDLRSSRWVTWNPTGRRKWRKKEGGSGGAVLNCSQEEQSGNW